MGGIFKYDADTGVGYYVDDKEVAEVGGMVALGLGALTIYHFVFMIIGLALISPFITLFVLDDFVDTFIANNALLFACIGVVIAVLKLLPKFTGAKLIRGIFDAYIVVAALYFVLYVLHFDILVYSFFKILDNYLPDSVDSAVLNAIGIEKMSALLEGNWFYEFLSDCAEKFLDYVKWSAQNVMNIDKSCFQVPAAELNILAALKTLIVYLAVGGFSILSVLFFGILMFAAFLLSVALPYALALTVMVVCNKLIFKLHTGKVQREKIKPIDKAMYDEIVEEFNFLIEGTSGSTPKRTFDLSQKLANEGNPHAQLSLAQCYFHGKGTPANDEKAIYWYEKAAYQGVTKAQIMVAFFYFDGIGVKRDWRLAKAWLNVALQNKGYFERQMDKKGFANQLKTLRKKTRFVDSL